MTVNIIYANVYNKPDFSLIVPTYNERDNIAILIEKIDKALKQANYEVIIVDDNSPDGTSELARTLVRQYPITVITRKNQRGLASAIVEGFKQAEGSILGVIDADLQHPPEILPKLLERVKNGAGMAIASRYIDGGEIKGWSIKRQIISVMSKLLAQILLPTTRKIKDPLSGFFIIKREVIKGIRLSPTGYKIALEILVKGHTNEIVEVPYTFVKREKGKSNLDIREGINYIIHLYSLVKYRRSMQYAKVKVI